MSDQPTILGGRYRVVGVLGRGGMGTVYHCHDDSLGADWAVKELQPPDGEHRQAFIEQFTAEARILAQLRHPGLPRVAAFFEENGSHYLVMDRIQGETLATRLDRHEPIAIDMAVSWLDDVLGVLDYLHSQQPPVLFRDLTPANIMLSDGDRIHLIDFGLARLAPPTGRTQPALKGYGSSGYAPPEQYGQASTETRSDLYGLAATAYHILTGAPPPDSVHRLVDHETLIEPWRLNSLVPEPLSDWVVHGMALKPEERFPSAREMQVALRKVARGESYAPEETALPASLLADQFVERLDTRLRSGGWARQQPPEPFVASYSRKLSRIFVRVTDPLDTSAVDTMHALAGSRARGESSLLPSTTWYVLAGPSPNPVDVAATAAATLKRGFRSQVILPVDLQRGECLDRHVPKEMLDSNNLSDAVLNVRIAAKG